MIWFSEIRVWALHEKTKVRNLYLFQVTGKKIKNETKSNGKKELQ